MGELWTPTGPLSKGCGPDESGPRKPYPMIDLIRQSRKAPSVSQTFLDAGQPLPNAKSAAKPVRGATEAANPPMLHRLGIHAGVHPRITWPSNSAVPEG